MKYDLYYDESKEDGYWHGVLLIPRNKRGDILDLIQEIRNKTNYQSEVSLKKVKEKGRLFTCVKGFAQLGRMILQQKFKKIDGDNYERVIFKDYSCNPNNLHKIEDSYHNIFILNNSDKIFGAKFILFKKRGNLKNMGTLYADNARKVETTLRMGIKGGLKMLSSEEDRVEIKTIHFDDYRHYGRHLKISRMIEKIGELPDYCKLSKSIEIFDKNSNHRKEDSQSYDDCQFLQLVDVLVSGFRVRLNSSNKFQKRAVFPLEKLICNWKKGKKRMENSRWNNGFCFSECYLEDDDWKFNNFLQKRECEENNEKFDF